MPTIKKIPHVIRTILRTDLGKAITIAIVWQLVLTIGGVLVQTLAHQLDLEPFAFLYYEPTSILSHTSNLDGGRYLEIILWNGYTNPTSQAPVFYPLFPLLVQTLHFLSFGLIPYLWAGLIINTAALALIIFLIIKICHILMPKLTKLPRITIILFLAFPAAFFTHMFYTEAVFIALGLLSYYFALKRAWWKVGLTLAALTAIRLPALLFIGLCGLEYFRAHRYKIKAALNKQIFWFLLAPLGFLGYSLFLQLARGDPLAMFNAYNYPNTAWDYQKFNPNFIATILTTITDAIRLKGLYAGTLIEQIGFMAVGYILPLLSILVVFVTSLFGLIKIKKWATPLSIFGLASIIFFTLNSNMHGTHRYVLTTISIFFILGYIYSKYHRSRPAFVICITLSILTQIMLFTGFCLYYFVG